MHFELVVDDRCAVGDGPHLARAHRMVDGLRSRLRPRKQFVVITEVRTRRQLLDFDLPLRPFLQSDRNLSCCAHGSHSARSVLFGGQILGMDAQSFGPQGDGASTRWAQLAHGGSEGVERIQVNRWRPVCRERLKVELHVGSVIHCRLAPDEGAHLGSSHGGWTTTHQGILGGDAKVAETPRSCVQRFCAINSKLWPNLQVILQIFANG
mmetsp:Transcript_2286/g.6589  ORF Transcript_2286/g.6589 Transcript_2286/m.6589 type:complete len:209 (+) Transcript_2286:306-932(+)